ncbi:acyl-CoA thioesterase domain-containing protein [Pseudomonas denitrificans (nom. rej.)]|uniref:acyl-CoA thioesterase domain-containing protein n=1 Tax=Pseudomonas denitrificans TaxID=43306 RepID=UPI00336AA708
MTDTALHPFDRAVALQPVVGQPNLYEGHTSQDYWNMVGPFGGVTAAVLLQGALRHPQLLGSPVSLTVNYAAAVVAGAFQVEAVPVRTNRSTQHWLLQLTQADEAGEQQVTTTATLVTALRRETWSLTDIPAPDLAPPSDFEPMSPAAKG